MSQIQAKGRWGRRIMVTALVLLAASAQASVSLKNGNFFISYTDIFYPGGFEPKIERSYNSKTAYKGNFGYGWGTEYEVYLTVSADGSVVVHEYGGGAENRFTPDRMNPKEVENAVKQIADAARASGKFGTPEQLARYRQQLASDASYRNEQWETFVLAGKVKKRELTVGTQLKSNKFSYQVLTRTADGYTRTFDNGKLEQFDNAGRLRKVTDKNGNFLAFQYGEDGRLAKIQDNFNRKMFFTFENGLVKTIEGENKKKASYDYNAKGELLASTDVDGNKYKYSYDGNDRHNLTQIAYTDGTTQNIAYYGKDKYENVLSVKSRENVTTEYTYDYGVGAKKGQFKVGVKVSDKDKKLISQSSYEYEMKNKADGEEWTYRMVATVDGERTETTYNECCGLPLLIKQGGQETAFEYNAKGMVTKKTTPFEVTELSYDPKANKVAKVMRYPKGSKAKAKSSEFTYDAKGNLSFAKNSEGKGVKLVYDGQGRILSMLDQNRRRIDFKYDQNSKPIEISDPALGSIKVNYTNSGELKDVEPGAAGRKVALQVTSAFQNLLEIIRPAGVNLGF